MFRLLRWFCFIAGDLLRGEANFLCSTWLFSFPAERCHLSSGALFSPGCLSKSPQCLGPTPGDSNVVDWGSDGSFYKKRPRRFFPGSGVQYWDPKSAVTLTRGNTGARSLAVLPGLFPCGTRGHRRSRVLPWPAASGADGVNTPAPCRRPLLPRSGRTPWRALLNLVYEGWFFVYFFNIIKRVIGILLRFDILISCLGRKSLSVVT